MDNQPSSELLWGVVAGAVALGLLAIIYRWHTSRGRSALQQWASKKRFKVLGFRRCFFSGRFPWWTTSQRQTVFFVTIRDESGRERSGWVRFGDILGGGYSHEPDVVWNETGAA